MDSEKMLLNMYKKHQYESTLTNIQGIVMAFSAAGILAAAVLTLFLISNMLLFYLFLSVLFVIGVAFALNKLKAVSLNIASLIYLIYICVLFIPASWVFADGIDGGAPFVMVIVTLAVVIVFSGRTRKVMQYCYLAVMLALCVYSIVMAPAKDMLYAIYKSAAFLICSGLIVYYMNYMLRKYDQMHDKFLKGSIKDELTRVLSRSVLDVVMDYAEDGYKEQEKDYVMIMIDVDNFKRLNDEYGHVVGDIVLRNTAVCIRKHMREEDFVIRYGGDEFLVVLIGASLENAKYVFERVEEEQECQRLLDFKITVSRGYAARSECKSFEELVKLADTRMYANKEAKR